MRTATRLVIAWTIISCSTAFAASPCSEDDFAMAQRYYHSTEAKYNAGVLQKFALNRAADTMIEAKYCSGKIEKAEYCVEKSIALRGLFESAASRVGTAATSTVMASYYYKELTELRRYCAQ